MNSLGWIWKITIYSRWAGIDNGASIDGFRNLRANNSFRCIVETKRGNDAIFNECKARHGLGLHIDNVSITSYFL